MQGEIERRVDKYAVAKVSGFTRSRFKVKNITVVTTWGDNLDAIPESLTVNLSKNTAWSLGKEIELRTTEENEAIMLEESDICDTNDDEDETAGNKSVKDDENGESCRTKITPNTNESDSESLVNIKLSNINHEDDTSTITSMISDDVS